MRDELRRLALFTSGVAELTRHRAERLVKDLANSGELPGGQMQSLVKEVMERSRQNRKELVTFLRTEIRNQVEGLGLASKRDLERLERRVVRLEDRTRSTGAARAKTTAKKGSTKRSGTKTARARKTTGSTGRRRTGERSSAPGDATGRRLQSGTQSPSTKGPTGDTGGAT